MSGEITIDELCEYMTTIANGHADVFNQAAVDADLAILAHLDKLREDGDDSKILPEDDDCPGGLISERLRSCRSCRYYRPNPAVQHPAGDGGYCQHEPPVVIVAGSPDGARYAVTRRPETRPNDACSKWEAKP
ncbi:hypothetical protein [Nitrosomonas sp.]|uniref:hypothetical protein n=1 Tax=Nitrosomonas sp. TaxID=42353 RepID=UPI0025DBC85C|nr:hypothetical protein [Nitrosomonas sp.]MBV6448540.1 hypothetical protein [Nitrosomonas sp.]